MKHPIIFRSAFTFVLLMAGIATFGQSNNGAVWKKTVYRTIDLTEKETKKKSNLKDASATSHLAEIMYNAAMMDKMHAYWTYDNNLTHMLTTQEVHELFGGGKPDTISVTDPVTNIETIRVVRRDPDLESFQKFRLLEEWTHNTATGKTDIQIIGVAPVKEVYGTDGRYRGEQVLMWVKYADALPSIAKYDGLHPTNTFAMHIWDDYFMSDVKPKEAK